MIPLLGDHLWQSTLFATAAALLAVALRGNRAAVRYGIWLAASVKFLVPFAALSAAGRALGARWAPPALAPPEVARVIDTVGQPFSQPLAYVGSAAGADPGVLPFSWGPVLAAIWTAGAAAVFALWWARWRRVARIARAGTRLVAGREVDRLRRLGGRLPIVACDGTLEPGVFGIARPVLLWPRGISPHLRDEQIDAILAHELAHLRRRDNLTAAVHMLVQILCWFHPLVWWIGARLVHERERACDEHVLQAGSTPQVYAESILRTCELSVASPLTCVSGVTGASLKQRIETIMRNRRAAALSSPRKILLTTAGLVAIAGPIALGGLDARPLQPAGQTPEGDTLAFEAASIKPNTSGEPFVAMRMLPGGAYEAINVTMRALIQQAFRMTERQVLGGPSWLENDRFDVLAKSPEGATPAQLPDRLRTLLVERLQLKTHREMRDMPIYALVLARDDGRLGPQIARSPVDCRPGAARRGEDGADAARRGGAGADASPGGGRAGGRQQGPGPMPALGSGPRPCAIMFTPQGLMGGGQTMAQIAQVLQNNAGRIVQDRTGLDGAFDFDLQFTRDPALAGRGPGGGLPPQPGAPPAPGGDAVSIFTAVQEQLGLRLEPATGPVEVVVIDSVERPTEN